MNAELKHQLYGGEISDYMGKTKPNKPLIYEDGVDSRTTTELEAIYTSQIKGKPSIDTTGIYNNTGLPPVERDPHYDKIGAELTKTLNAIAQQLNLSNSQKQSNIQNKSVVLKAQTDSDIAAANDNVKQALKELQELKAI
jgi:hypothetical protein